MCICNTFCLCQLLKRKWRTTAYPAVHRLAKTIPIHSTPGVLRYRNGASPADQPGNYRTGHYLSIFLSIRAFYEITNTFPVKNRA